MRKLFKLTLLTTLLLLTSACQYIQKSGGSGTHIHVLSAQYLNPDINGKAAPIVITFYQLKSPFSFKQANYTTLSTNSGKALGSDLIDKQTIEIRPGADKTVWQPLSSQTQYLGIIAAYRNIDQANWRAVIKVSPKKDNQLITLHLQSQSMAVDMDTEKKWGFKL